LETSVKEQSNGQRDTLFFTLKNPIEGFYKKNGIRNRDIYYKISIYGANTGLMDNLSSQSYDNGNIKIVRPKGVILDKFSVNAYPKSNFGGRNIGIKEIDTYEYHVKEETSNLFEVNIPGLSCEYMTYIRLNRDFVRIINNTKLEWDGFFYMKQ